MKLSLYAVILTGSLAGLAVVPAQAKDCPGTFIRDSQNYDNRTDPNKIERLDSIVPKGTKDLIVGYVVVGGKKYYVQLRAYLHDPADIRLKAGCVLEKYG